MEQTLFVFSLHDRMDNWNCDFEWVFSFNWFLFVRFEHCCSCIVGTLKMIFKGQLYFLQLKFDNFFYNLR